jgi:hypothetical protein
MVEILYIENAIILSRLEAELTGLNIDYIIKKTDISALPSNLNKNYYAVLFSDIKNQEIILEIYEKIKMDQTIEFENNQNKGTTNILNKIALIILFVLLIGIIIYQNIMYNNLVKAINQSSNAYIYKYLQNGKEIEVYFRKDNIIVGKYIDNNKNGINEIIETYLPNGFKTISEDLNENGYSEIIKTYKDDILLIESFSTKDNGISDISKYYKDGILEKTIIYNENNNEITIKY